MDSKQSQQIGEAQPNKRIKFKKNNLGPSNSDISMFMQPLNPAFQQNIRQAVSVVEVPLRALNFPQPFYTTI